MKHTIFLTIQQWHCILYKRNAGRKDICQFYSKMWNFSELVNAFYSYPIYSIDAKITTHNKAFQLFEALFNSMFDNSNFLTINKLCISDKYCFLLYNKMSIYWLFGQKQVYCRPRLQLFPEHKHWLLSMGTINLLSFSLPVYGHKLYALFNDFDYKLNYLHYGL